VLRSPSRWAHASGCASTPPSRHSADGPGRSPPADRAPKGDRRYAWAWLATASPGHFLLIRRSLTKPTEVAYFFCYVPDGTPATLGVLVAVCGRRRTVEEDHEFGKDQVRLPY
jgi:hypothetical protein